ncbi:DUF6525 family protein [Sagittula sp. SSi028]|uniref:DUF6525 family protein n=1 Tax=Sagittula sp. SSi028 TaxID=3400636 RepID=UPI003AF88C81
MYNRNLGQVPFRRKKRGGDVMAQFDRLPAPVRRWMAEAALPWSPKSCLAIWRRALAEQGSEAAALDRLRRAEKAALDGIAR